MSFHAQKCFSQILEQQRSEYPIQNYLYPDVDRTYFFLSPDLSFFRYKRPDTTAAQFSGRLNVSRGKVLNQRKKQHSNYVNLNLGYFHSNSSTLSNRGYANVDVDNTLRYFYREKRYFELETNFYGALNSNRFGSSIPDLRWLTSEIVPKIGWGRIELITDSWHATNILEQLRKTGYLSEDLNNEDFFQLSELISEIKNYRNPDGRLERISELEALTKFFADRNLISEAGIGFFAELDDAYRFEGFVRRTHGRAFTLGLRHYYSVYRNASLELGADSEIYNNASLQLTYEKNKAINENWQFDQFYAVEAGFWNYQPILQDEFNNFTFHRLVVDLTVGYYPNRRTFISLTPGLNYRTLHDSNNEEYYADIDFQGYYYVSPRLRYQLRANLSKAFWEDIEVINDLEQNYVNFSMTYFLR